MISFRCDCGKQLQAQEEYAGQTTACPTCGRELTIPGAGALPARERREGLLPLRRRERRDDDERSYGDVPGQTSGKAITALVLGLLSFCVPLLLSIPAIILGILGLGDVGRGRGRVGGRGLAITGIVLGSASMLIGPLVALLLVMPAWQKVREAKARVIDQNNLKQIALAMFQHNDTFKKLPPAAVYSQDRRPLYSWRVLLLPYLEQANLYNQFHLNEPWDSPHNMQFVKQMPRVYAHPMDPDGAKNGLTHYQVFVVSASEQGPGPPFRNNPLALEPFPLPVPGTFAPAGGTPRIPASFPDGTSNTILVAEAAKGVPWTSPEDLPYSARQPVPPLGGLFSGGYNVALGDSSVRFLSDRISDQTLRAAITANGGEPLGPDWDN